MISEFRHTGLVVNDLDGAIHFWRDVIGFSEVRTLEESGPHIDAILHLADARLTTVKLVAPNGAMLELLKFHSHSGSKKWHGEAYSTGFTHVALTINSFDDCRKRLESAGVQFLASPQVSPDGKVKVTYCRGPENILIEFVEKLVD